MWTHIVTGGALAVIMMTLQGCGSSSSATTTVTTTVAPTSTVTSTAAPHTCALMGCDSHDETCYCTSTCHAHQDCCEDYSAKCETTTTAGPTTTPKPLDCPETFQVRVLSYNLFWWNVVGNGARGGVPAIHNRLNEFGPFDFMGFQECEGVDQVVNGINQQNVGRTQLVVEPAGKTGKDVCLAWDGNTMTKLSEGNAKIGHDGFSDRWMIFVRLSHGPSGRIFFFATAHGAIQQCEAAQNGDAVAKLYLDAIHNNMQDGDVLIMTGDFNCGRDSLVLKTIAKEFPDVAWASHFPPVLEYPDNIFIGPSDNIEVKEWETFPLTPSDHNGLYGNFTVCKGSSTIEV